MKATTALGAGLLAILVASAASAEATGRLVLYTSQPNADAQQAVDATRAMHPGGEVELLREGTTALMAKLEAEYAAGSPQPDVPLIADSVTMEGLKAQGRQMAHESADIAAHDPATMDADRCRFSTKLITTGIVYNMAAPMVPTSWADLLKAEAKDLIVMPLPLTSGAATIHMVSLTGHPDLFWGYQEGLASQGALAQGGNGGVQTAVAGGEKLYGMVVDFLPIRARADGAPVEFVFPAKGVSFVTEPVATLSTAQHPEAARAVVDFLLSREGQKLAASQGYLPAHPEVTPPPGFPPRSEIRFLDFDPARALAEDTQTKLRFTDLFGG